MKKWCGTKLVVLLKLLYFSRRKINSNRPMNSLLKRYASKSEAVFILLPSGLIQECNDKAAELFGFNTSMEMKGLSAADLVPADFQQYFPAEITEEHLTDGKYLPRVNKTKQGLLFPTEVLTYFKIWGDQQYVLVHIRPTKSEQIETLLLKQNIDVLNSELSRERNQNSEKQQEEIFHRLGTVFPQLTSRDMEFCCLLMKNYSSKQIAGCLNITLEGVFAARKRLRKKLNVPAGGELVAFLHVST